MHDRATMTDRPDPITVRATVSTSDLADAIEADWRQVVQDYVAASTPASSPADRDAARTRLYHLAYLREAGRPMVIHHHSPVDTTDSDALVRLAERLQRA